MPTPNPIKFPGHPWPVISATSRDHKISHIYLIKILSSFFQIFFTLHINSFIHLTANYLAHQKEQLIGGIFFSATGFIAGIQVSGRAWVRWTHSSPLPFFFICFSLAPTAIFIASSHSYFFLFSKVFLDRPPPWPLICRLD